MKTSKIWTFIQIHFVPKEEHRIQLQNIKDSEDAKRSKWFHFVVFEKDKYTT